MAIPTTTPTTPSGRVRRSVIQSAIGTLLAVPTIVNGEHVTIAKGLKYGGTATGFILAAAVIQNFAESRGWLKTNG